MEWREWGRGDIYREEGEKERGGAAGQRRDGTGARRGDGTVARRQAGVRRGDSVAAAARGARWRHGARGGGTGREADGDDGDGDGARRVMTATRRRRGAAAATRWTGSGRLGAEVGEEGEG
uniref:Uncharacterized protein n=1 Tax=Oryza sativa subsp. japonica TaxID=39947 RepID=Q10PC0_ORYSJ|nr:hypothetical protein LOC_Os03g13660 [Oryza sativa Japonica Group]